MLYEFCAYGSDYEERRIIRWLTSKKFTPQPVICGKLVTFMDFETKKYVIPEGVTALGEQCFVDSEADNFDCFATKLILPASLERIEDNALVFTSFKSIVLATENQHFVLHKGGLYTADGKRLIYVCTPNPEDPAATEHVVKDGTEVIDMGVPNNYVTTLHIPASVKRFGDGECFINWNEFKFYAPEDSFAARFAEENGVELILEK